MAKWIVEAETLADIVNGRWTGGKKIVLCKDCKWADWYTAVSGKQYCYCIETDNGGRTENDYCSFAERRE